MNIRWSVTERTREIGLRIAIGAKGRNILAQFLTESLVLAVSGGIIGIILGISTTQILAQRFGWAIPIRPEVIALAVGFSGLVGVGFGLFPARKALHASIRSKLSVTNSRFRVSLDSPDKSPSRRAQNLLCLAKFEACGLRPLPKGLCQPSPISHLIVIWEPDSQLTIITVSQDLSCELST